MIGRMSVQLHLFLGLCLALVLGWLYQLPIATDSNGKIPTPSPIPVFETLSGGWLLQVRFYADKPPEVVKLVPLPELRVEPDKVQGVYSFRILDTNSNELFSRRFDVFFLKTGSSKTLESVEKSLLIPNLDGASRVIVHTPQGALTYELPEK